MRFVNLILFIMWSCAIFGLHILKASRHVFLTRYFFQVSLQLGALAISPDEPTLSVDDLADQIAEVLDYFG